LKNQLGPSVGREIYNLLARKGIERSEISEKFDQVVQALNEAFGAGARVIVYKTVVELYAEYSVSPKFTFNDSLTDQIFPLRDKVLVNGLKPKHPPSIKQDPKPAVRDSARK
jgi:hypothetical protein